MRKTKLLLFIFLISGNLFAQQFQVNDIFAQSRATLVYPSWNSLSTRPFMQGNIYCPYDYWNLGCTNLLDNDFSNSLNDFNSMNYSKEKFSGAGEKQFCPHHVDDDPDAARQIIYHEDTSNIPKEDIKEPREIVSSSGDKTFVPLSEFTALKPLPLFPNPKTGMSKNCSMFIKSNGTLGSAGQSLIKQIRRHKSFYEPESKNITKVCKNWKSLSNKEKEIFWLWTFSSISHDESSCSPRALVRGMPGRRAAGLFQIEYKQKNRSFRERECRNLTSAQTLGPNANIGCAVAMMSGFIDDPKMNFVFDKKTYWHHLRSGTSKIKQHLNKNPVCD